MPAKPKCTKVDCFQNKCGARCELLIEPIVGHECPFYKTDKEVDQGRIDAHQKLVNMERFDLIQKYEYNPYRRGQW